MVHMTYMTLNMVEGTLRYTYMTLYTHTQSMVQKKWSENSNLQRIFGRVSRSMVRQPRR